MSVLSDGIGDRDIPGATANQLVDVSTVDAHSNPSFLFFFCRCWGGERMWFLKRRLGCLLCLFVVNDGN